jgi:hypothetical protein
MKKQRPQAEHYSGCDWIQTQKYNCIGWIDVGAWIQVKKCVKLLCGQLMGIFLAQAQRT